MEASPPSPPSGYDWAPVAHYDPTTGEVKKLRKTPPPSPAPKPAPKGLGKGIDYIARSRVGRGVSNLIRKAKQDPYMATLAGIQLIGGKPLQALVRAGQAVGDVVGGKKRFATIGDPRKDSPNY